MIQIICGKNAQRRAPPEAGTTEAGPPHTDRFWVELFQNYGFKEWIFLKDLKLWLFVLTKTLF